MPELPEVQTVVSSLRPKITGGKLRKIRLMRGDIVMPAGTSLEPLLAGRTVTSVDRRAKRIVFTLDDCNRFYIHLGMTGRLTADPIDAPLKPHTHLIMPIENAPFEIRFVDPRRFGGVFWLGRESFEKDLGPEPLTLRPSRLMELLQKTSRSIKTALLDQSLIAGLGNIYADESLFLSRIHPLAPANRLAPAQVRRLNRAIKLILRRAIAARGSTLRDFVDADNAPGSYRARHKVYDREGEPCPSCRAPIARIVLSGRSTCYCPKCQPTQSARRSPKQTLAIR